MFLEKKTLKSTDKKQKRRFQLLNFYKKQAYLASRQAPVAQRIEHLTSNQAVTGSNPVRGTISFCLFSDFQPQEMCFCSFFIYLSVSGIILKIVGYSGINGIIVGHSGTFFKLK